ncbi:MAG: autoinducer binding domain-containing protein, partial [Shimia sp.]
PAGYYIAIRIGFAFPVLEDNRLPPAWVETYTSEGLMLRDPVMSWMYENTGAIRWEDLPGADPLHVIERARMHGLAYGVSVSVMDEATNERSFGSFTRADRPFTEDEIAVLGAQLEALHRDKRRPEHPTDAETEVLRMIRNGQRFKEIAHDLGISESAVKARLTNAKRKLGAKTSVQAVSIASEFGML